MENSNNFILKIRGGYKMNYFISISILMLVGCSSGSMKFEDADKYKEWYNKKEKSIAQEENRKEKLIQWEPMK